LRLSRGGWVSRRGIGVCFKASIEIYALAMSYVVLKDNKISKEGNLLFLRVGKSVWRLHLDTQNSRNVFNIYLEGHGYGIGSEKYLTSGNNSGR
jgi:hypothetical protein